jgi:hypothetical protein
VRSAYLNARRSHIKNDIGYKMEDKHNTRMNNNSEEFIKGNSHQVKQDNKATNHISNIDANVFYMPYHAFDASYVIMKNKYEKVITLYVGPCHKRHNTCVWVPKVLVTNMKGSKQVWLPKNKA